MVAVTAARRIAADGRHPCATDSARLKVVSDRAAGRSAGGDKQHRTTTRGGNGAVRGPADTVPPGKAAEGAAVSRSRCSKPDSPRPDLMGQNGQAHQDV